MRRSCALGMLGLVVAVVVGAGPGRTAHAQAQSPGSASAVRFTDAAMREVEGRQQVQIVVERTDLPVSRLLVHYRTQDGTSPTAAVAGSDYVHAAGTLVFDVGVRSSSFRVVLRDDDVTEETEHLFLQLETSSGSAASTRLTVLDDDVAPTALSSATAPPPVAAPAPARSTQASPATSAPPVVVAASAGVRRPVEARTRTRVVAARPAAPRRIILQQTPSTPFELRPTPDSAGAYGGTTSVDPLLALAGGLLLARVAAEAWFRARIAAS